MDPWFQGGPPGGREGGGDGGSRRRRASRRRWLRVDLVAGAMVFPERVGGSEWFRKVEGKRMVALGGQGGSGYGEFS